MILTVERMTEEEFARERAEIDKRIGPRLAASIGAADASVEP